MGPAGQFRKDDVAPQHQFARVRQAVLVAVDIGLDQPLHVLEIPQPRTRDQRNGIDVPRLVEVVSVGYRQFFGELPWRARAAALQFGVSLGGGDFPVTEH